MLHLFGILKEDLWLFNCSLKEPSISPTYSCVCVLRLLELLLLLLLPLLLTDTLLVHLLLLLLLSLPLLLLLMKTISALLTIALELYQLPSGYSPLTPHEHPTPVKGLGAFTKIFFALDAQLNEALKIRLSNNHLYLQDCMKCLFTRLRKIFPMQVLILSKKSGAKQMTLWWHFLL